jgi:hypothetical protein
LIPPGGRSLSLDGLSVAFIGYRFNQGQQETVLFLYRLGQLGLHQVDIPAIAHFSWSPASDAILLFPPGILYDGWTLQDVYLYDLQSDMLTQLTNTSDDIEGYVMWLPDNDHIVFVGTDVPCQSSCTSYASNLYAMDRAGENLIRLTDLGSQVPSHPTLSYFYCVAAQPTWSGVEARIYYVARCMEDDHYHDHLYSVSLDGDNRLEANLPALYPDNRYTIIRDIYPSSTEDGIYLTVTSQTEPVPEDRSPTVNNWHVFHVSQPEHVAIVFEYDAPYSHEFADSMLSPDEQWIALGSSNSDMGDGSGTLWIANLNSGQIELQMEFPEQVCQVEWLDNQRLLFNVFSQRVCAYSAGTWILNVETGASEEITAELDGFVSVSVGP